MNGDSLEHLFGSPLRARLLKIFLMSPDRQFATTDLAEKTGMREAAIRAELKRLVNARILKATKARVMIRKSGDTKHVWLDAFVVQKDYPFFSELRLLILKSAPHAKSELVNRLKKIGNIKLAILAGVFIDNENSRADLLVVGDGIGKSRMKSFISWVESEIGKELSYVAMSSSEFKYRMDMYDRFIRDMLEFPHETIINKLGV